MPTGGGGGGPTPSSNTQVNSFGIGTAPSGTAGDLTLKADGRITSVSGTLQISGGNGYLGTSGNIYGFTKLIFGPSDPGVSGGIYMPPVLFATLPAAAAGNAGAFAVVSDSTTVVWGATITGTGGNKVLAFSDGTNWTVAAK